MQKKPRLFFADRKEMLVLFFLAFLVVVFAFTLGLHLGKRVAPRTQEAVEKFPSTVGTVGDEVPNQQELADQSKEVHQAAEDALDKAAHDEVVRLGLSLDKGAQVDLPRGTRSKNSGATSEKSIGSAPPVALPTKTHDPAPASAPGGKYTLQVGSFSTDGEAQAELKKVQDAGVSAQVRPVDVPGKGKWYRLYVGSYASREMATVAGQGLVTKKVITSFVVSNAVQ